MSDLIKEDFQEAQDGERRVGDAIAYVGILALVVLVFIAFLVMQ